MASIGTDRNGRFRILFVDDTGSRKKRKTVRLLPDADEDDARDFKRRIERLIAQRRWHNDPDILRWADGLKDEMHERLAGAGLVKSRNVVTVIHTVGTMLASVFDTLSVKGGTRTTYSQTRTSLEAYLGKDKPLTDVGRLDADKWRKSMEAEGLAQPTISKRVKTARQFFRQAVDWDMLLKNPIDRVKAGTQKNRSRMYMVSREDTQKLIDACPDAEWRAIVALSRFGGLRCPSEHLLLKLADVDWEKGRVRVTSPKTEHYDGGDHRMIPLFPELRAPLLELYEQAEPGTVYFINRYRSATQNLRTQFQRIIGRAGLKPWPRLFHNLRASRQTELTATHPEHVVCGWIGNSEKVARDHYLHTTDADFDLAVSAAQNAAHTTAEQDGIDRKSVTAENEKTPVFPGLSVAVANCVDKTMTPTGFEPVSRP